MTIKTLLVSLHDADARAEVKAQLAALPTDECGVQWRVREALEVREILSELAAVPESRVLTDCDIEQAESVQRFARLVRSPQVRSLLLWNSRLTAPLVCCLRHYGVQGHLHPADSAALPQALQWVAQGESYWSPPIVQQVLHWLLEFQTPCVQGLSLRDSFLLYLLGESWSYPQLIATLGVHRRTLERRIAHLCKKFFLNNTQQLRHFAASSLLMDWPNATNNCRLPESPKISKLTRAPTDERIPLQPKR